MKSNDSKNRKMLAATSCVSGSVASRRAHFVCTILALAFFAFVSALQPASAAGAKFPGDLDTTFGANKTGATGINFAFHDENSTGTAMVVQDDAKIVVLGDVTQQVVVGVGKHVNAVARLRADGTLDADLKTGFVPGIGRAIVPSELTSATVIALQGDAILVAGSAQKKDRSVFALARFLKDGTLDTGDGKLNKGFGGRGTGTATTEDLFAGNARASGVAIDLSGNIIVAGTVEVRGWSDFALARFDKQGVLDQTFGDGGKILTTFQGPATLSAVAIQKNGNIVVAGTVWLNETAGYVGLWSSEWVLVSYDPRGGNRRDGWRETRLGLGGIVYTFFSTSGPGFDQAHAIAVQKNDGLIVVAGSTLDPTGKRHFAVARYDLERSDLAHGWLDTRFGGVGKFRIRFPGGADTSANAVAILPDTRIVVAGSAFLSDRFPPDFSSSTAFAVAFFNADGSSSRGFRDPTFGTGGVSMAPIGTRGGAIAVAVQLDPTTRAPKIVAAGTGPCDGVVCGGSTHAWVARYMTNP